MIDMNMWYIVIGYYFPWRITFFNKKNDRVGFTWEKLLSVCIMLGFRINIAPTNQVAEFCQHWEFGTRGLSHKPTVMMHAIESSASRHLKGPPLSMPAFILSFVQSSRFLDPSSHGSGTIFHPLLITDSTLIFSSFWYSLFGICSRRWCWRSWPWVMTRPSRKPWKLQLIFMVFFIRIFRFSPLNSRGKIKILCVQLFSLVPFYFNFCQNGEKWKIFWEDEDCELSQVKKKKKLSFCVSLLIFALNL